MKIRIGEEILTEHIRIRLRMDFRGEHRSGKFLFGGRSKEEVAELMRDQQVAMLRNVPMQGITLEDIDMSIDVYVVNETVGRRVMDVAYAPLLLTMRLDNIDDLLPLLLRTEFRKIEFLSPENVNINRLDLERLLYRVNQSFQSEMKVVEEKYLH